MQTGSVLHYGSSMLAYLYMPVIALAVVGILALVLRWASPPRKQQRPARTRPAGSGDYGLLVPIGRYETAAEAEHVAHELRVHGIKASSAPDGPRHCVLAWKSQESIARVVASRMHGPA
ncbi:MAG: hypothetical protein ACRDO8_10760 [Nocardioidaceae bacterium]